MEAVVAFKTNKQAYVLPRNAGASGLIIVSQPRFIPLAQATALPSLASFGTPENIQACIQGCSRSHNLIDHESLQGIYTWWMGMRQEERDPYFE